MKHYVIIVAGGSGNRMKSEIPKQFLLLNGLPVLMHTIKAFYQSSMSPQIIVVLNEGHHSYWSELQKKHQFDIPHVLVKGGAERFDSVKNALDMIKGETLIAVHDAVRPIISNDIISRCFEKARVTGTAVPVVSPKDSLRQKVGLHTISIRREDIFIVQTPQVFNSTLLKKAYQQSFSPQFTDDASVVEKSGVNIELVEGDQKNIKITYPEDLEIASLFMKRNPNGDK